jgi:hypothetical protein
MNRYEMQVVAQVLTIDALTEEDAEAKYDAYFNQEPCPCGADDCSCVDDSEECDHITTLIKENI